jgi:hypothetical protein
MKHLLIILFFLYSVTVLSQVGIGTTSPEATLDVVASNQTTPNNADGLLIPRINAFPTTNPTINQQSMLVYLTTDLTSVNISGAAQNYSEGFYYWDNVIPNWVALGEGEVKGWLTEGNTGTDGGTTNFLGTIDNQPLSIRLNNTQRFRLTQKGQIETFMDGGTIAIGPEAAAADDGSNNQNIFIGEDAGRNTVGDANPTEGKGSRNVGIGFESLMNNVAGQQNTAVGYRSQKSNSVPVGSATTSVGGSNSSFGYNSLEEDTNPSANTAIGAFAMGRSQNNTFNVSVGYESMVDADNNSYNTVVGDRALNGANGSQNNLVMGYEAGSRAGANITNSVILGYQAGRAAGDTSTANRFSENILIGREAMAFNRDGSNNVAIGYRSGLGNRESNNIFLGSETGRKNRGTTNTFIGFEAGK